MPTAMTSKDILKDAQDALKKVGVSDMAITDMYELVLKDCQAANAAMTKARPSLGALKTSIPNNESGINELEKAMAELKKNEAVMAAPADQKAYQQLMKDFGSRITACTKANTKAASTVKQCETMLK